MLARLNIGKVDRDPAVAAYQLVYLLVVARYIDRYLRNRGVCQNRAVRNAKGDLRRHVRRTLLARIRNAEPQRKRYHQGRQLYRPVLEKQLSQNVFCKK